VLLLREIESIGYFGGKGHSKMQFEKGLINKLELRHEVELLYRLKTGTSLSGRLGEKERYFGVERQIRF
jgi:hypothetical protein